MLQAVHTILRANSINQKGQARMPVLVLSAFRLLPTAFGYIPELSLRNGSRKPFLAAS